MLRSLLLAVACIATTTCHPETTPPPELFLWVWQRPEDLSFIEPASTRLALWVATIRLTGRELVVDARRAPVRYPPGTELVAVVRLETEPDFDYALREAVADRIAGLVGALDAGEVQIDFDATESQREFYAELLAEVRLRLPERQLSITALASWCYADHWLDDLPIDAAVPMYYRLGPDRDLVRRYLAERRQISAAICGKNAGYSLDEPDVPWVPAKRVFVFNAERWNETALDTTRRKLNVVMSR